jgi:hypothetical protein
MLKTDSGDVLTMPQKSASLTDCDAPAFPQQMENTWVCYSSYYSIFNVETKYSMNGNAY